MDVPVFVDESEQSWMRWKDIEPRPVPAAVPMREVIITPVPYAGTEQPEVIYVPITARDIPA